MELNFEGINKEYLPKHIAIIMDGNRRWAKKRNLPTAIGHKEGANALETTLHFCNKIGIQYLTVYAFSTENWKRTEEEVGALMKLLENYLVDFAKRADDENIKVTFIGDTTKLNSKLQKRIADTVERTKDNTGLVFNVAFNYGGREELTRACRNIAQKVAEGTLQVEQIEPSTIEQNLYTAGMPDPDVLIRTSGELRTSNFLPWQLVYSEFVFVEKYWPDFAEQDVLDAIKEYQKRNRKFGGK